MIQRVKHLRVSDAEERRIINRCEEDAHNARADHDARLDRFRRYEQKWRGRVDPPGPGDEKEPSFETPVLQGAVFGALGQQIAALFGKDAQITVKPTGPSDARRVAVTERWINWRVFESMKLVKPFIGFSLQQLINGRAHALLHWHEDEQEGKVWSSGPQFCPLRPDELIVPAERAESIQDFSFYLRQYVVSVEDLVQGEEDGRYVGILERIDDIVKLARQNLTMPTASDDVVRHETEQFSGVMTDYSTSGRDRILVHEWIGRWRPLKSKSDDADEYDFEKREMREQEFVYRSLPHSHLLIGAQRLRDLYPKIPPSRRRPIVEAAMLPDGAYWCHGLGSLCESIQDETTANHRLFTKAGRLQVGPMIIVRPTAGLTERDLEYEPFKILWSEDPASFQMLAPKGDLNYCLIKEQNLMAWLERVTGRSDLSLGRTIDRPNAPRTASGTVAMIEAGNIRVELDTMVFREDMKAVLQRIWDLDSSYVSENKWFRVTEEDSNGLIETSRGGAMMTPAEFGGEYDFSIQFATSYWSREANKQRFVEAYGLAIQNPFVATQPALLAILARELFLNADRPDLAERIPLPAMETSLDPREEWTRMLQGERVFVSPMDDDGKHLQDHIRRFEESKAGEDRDEAALGMLMEHIVQHEKQKREKAQFQGLLTSLVDKIGQNTATPGAGGLNANGPMPLSLQQLQATIGELAAPQGEGGAPQNGQPAPGATM